MLGVHGIVEVADVSGGELTGKIGEGGTKLGKSRESGLADNGNGVVGREVVAVVFEGDESEGIDEAIRGVTRDDVNLMFDKSAVDEAEVHDFGSFGEVEIIAAAPAAETVGTLEKLVADTDLPFGRKRHDVGDFLEMKIFRVVTPDDHGESVFEAEGLGDFEMEALGIELLDAVVDCVRIALWRFIQDGNEGGAGVFDVEVELASFEGFVDKQCATEVGFALDGDASFSFDVLG